VRNDFWFKTSAALGALCVSFALFSPLEVISRFRYPSLSPRIFTFSPNDTIINFTKLRSDLRVYAEKKDPALLRTGVYFEYLPTGVSIGIHEKDQFITASLLKVPFIMGVYKLYERNQLKPDDRLTLQQGDLDPDFGTLWKKGAGTTLSVAEAVRYALTQSDNTATRALDADVSDDLVQEVYDALDIPISLDKNEPVVSPKNYSSVFRCLYLSCFLSKTNSEDILQQLSHSIFTDGLPAGVPGSVRVSHKVGMYDTPDGGNRVRSDCGIIYLPRRPYILCAVAETPKGKEQLINSFFREISEKIYAYVSSQE
jgi:beta-lactamase class A